MKVAARLLCLIVVAGCGDDPPSNGGNGSYFPVAVGHRWVYLETDNVGTRPDQTDIKEITGTEDLDGEETFVMVSTPSLGQVVKRFNWTVTSERVDRVRAEDYFEELGGVLLQEHDYAAGFPRFISSLTTLGDSTTHEVRHACSPVDEPLCPALEIKEYTWSVEAVDEVITVPAGTFSCLKIRRQRAFGNYKEYWYARGVGKVFERGAVNDESLLEYMAE